MKKYHIVVLLLFFCFVSYSQIMVNRNMLQKASLPKLYCDLYGIDLFNGNQFQFAQDTRDFFLFTNTNPYLSTSKVCIYDVKKNAIGYVDDIYKNFLQHYIYFDGDTLYGYDDDTTFFYHIYPDTLKYYQIPMKKVNIFKTLIQLQLLDGQSLFNVNSKGDVAYQRNRNDTLIVSLNKSNNIQIPVSFGSTFFLISDTVLLFSKPQVEDNMGIITYSILLYNRNSQNTDNLIYNEKIGAVFDYYEGNLFFENNDKSLCRGEIIFKNNQYLIHSLDTICTFSTNVEIYGLNIINSEEYIVKTASSFAKLRIR